MSSLHIGTNSMENVNLKDFVLVWISWEINSSDFFIFMGATVDKKSTILTACDLWE